MLYKHKEDKVKKFFFVLIGLTLICRADWLQFQGDVANTGVSQDSVVVSNLLWQDSLAPLDFFSGPVTSNDMIFVPTLKGFYCLDVNNGDSLWYQSGSFSSVPAIISDRVVVVQAETLQCFTLDGDLLWSLGFPVRPSHPTVINGIIYLTAGRHVYAIDSSGASRWITPELRYGFTPNMAPCCNDTFVIVATKRGLLTLDPASVVYVLSSYDGRVLSSHDYGYGFVENGCLSTPTLFNNRLYFTTYHSTLFPGYGRSVQLPENTQRWQVRNIPNYYTSSVAIGDRVFFSGEGLWAYDSSGIRIWTANIGRVSYSSPLISTGMIWLGNDSGELFGVDAISGLIRQRFQCGNTPLTSPATTSGGNLIIADISGKVYSFGYVVVVEEPKIGTPASQLRSGIYYDITGRRLIQAPPTRKGIYFYVDESGSRKKIILH